MPEFVLMLSIRPPLDSDTNKKAWRRGRRADDATMFKGSDQEWQD